MGIFDRSRSTVTQQQFTENRPITITDSDEARVYEAGGDIYSVSTDFNAIDRATELAARSLDVGERLASQSQNIALETSYLVGDVSRDFGAQTERISMRAIESGEGTFDRALDFTRDLATRFQNTVASTVDAVQRIGTQQAKSTDERLADVSERSTRYVIIAAAVLGVGALAFAFYGRK